MRLVFRADASPECGAGHVMRISVLAEEAITQGLECIFIGEIQGLHWLLNRINNMGFQETHSNFDTYKSNPNTDILILDSYTIPVELEEIESKHWLYIVVIADKLTPKYKSNLVIKPNLTSCNSIKERNSVLEGPEYILVRKLARSSKKFKKQNSPLKIMVSGGGTDTQNFAKSIATELEKVETIIEVHFFSNTEIVSKTGKLFVTHNIGEELDRISEDADLAFTTASTSALEFIASKIPTGVVCAVNNQREYYEQLGELNYAIQIGEFTSQKVYKLKSANIKGLISDPEVRDRLTNNISNLIDANGASRILSAIKENVTTLYT